MVRKMTFLFLGTIALSGLTIVCELVVLALGCAPAQHAGASPRAAGLQVDGVGASYAMLNSPLRPPSREGPAAGGLGWTSAPAAPALRIALREVPVPGQPLARGGYASGTGLAGLGSSGDGSPAIQRSRATAGLLGTIMLLVILVVARDASRVRPEARAAAGGPSRPSPVPTTARGRAGGRLRPALLQLALWLARVPAPTAWAQHAPALPAPGNLFLRDAAADWMRCRLVPI